MSQAWYETTMIVEAAFGNGPYDPSPTWTDITEWVREPMLSNRGRTSEYSPFAPGTLSLVLDNRDRRFDPTHAAGPYFGDLNPMTPVRVRNTYDATTYPVFYGFALGFPQQLGKGYTDGTAQVRCVDAFRLLTQAQLSGSSYIVDVLASDPTHYWPMQDGNGSTYDDAAGDLVVYSRFGDDTNTPADFPVGASSLVAFGPSELSDGQFRAGDSRLGTLSAASRTLECWVYVDSLDPVAASPFDVIVGSATDTFNRIATIAPGTLPPVRWYAEFSDDATTRSKTITGPPITVGTHHVAVVADATTLHLYVDGQLVASETLDTSTLGNIGVVSGSTVGDSAVGHIASYPVALSAADITAHYLSGLYSYGHPYGERGGARIGRHLDEVNFPAGMRDLSTGDTVLGPYQDRSSALAACRQIETVDQGLFFVGRDGSATFRSRNWRFNQTSSATFADCDSSGLPFRDVRPDANTVDNIRNSATVTWQDGQIVVSDSASILAYGENSDPILARLIPSPNMARTLGAYIVRTRKDPATRIEYLKILPRRDPAALFPVVLGLELGDLITAVLTQLNVGDPTSYVLAVQGIRHTITRKSWETDLYLAPADVGPYFTVGDATLGRIGAAADNRIPY